MIQVQLKLQLRPAQERQLQRWLWHLTAVYNWAVRQIERDLEQGRRVRSRYDLEGLVSGHGPKIGVPQVVVADTVRTAYYAWQRCLKGLAHRPRFKGRRNRLNSIPSHERVRAPKGNRISFPCLPNLKFHRQDIPAGTIKCSRIVRRASGWYLCLNIDAEPRAIRAIDHAEVGIDPGFSSLLTLSSGEKIEHPRELERISRRIAQAQRGWNRRRVARLLERRANQQRNRNHQLSRRLVAENAVIAWSADRHKAVARSFGKSVAGAAHGQLRQMLAYKSRAGGRTFIEVPSFRSTRTCSACLALTGPTGWRGLKVRQWSCSACGAQHDRDVNAAANTLRVGRGMRHESSREAASETAA